MSKKYLHIFLFSLLCLMGSFAGYGQTKLYGTIIGDPLDGRQGFVFDGDVNTYYDAGGDVGSNHGWIGFALNGGYVISKVRFHPRVDGDNIWPCEKMLGGIFQGSNTADFANPVTLATITALPVINAWGEFDITNTTPFQYVRYLAPDLSGNTSGQTSSNLTIAELEFYTSTVVVPGPKQLYIPADWQNPTLNIPWDSTQRCKQSANFAVFWGPLAGNDPTQANNAALRFDPQVMLDSMEAIYNDYITKWHLLPDSANLAKYKIIIVMNNTWRDGLYTGYLFGGGFDNVIGAMFIDPVVVGATDSWGLSHEFTHACQYMITNVLYPGHGFNDVYSGFFWETHAQYMAWQRHPNGLGNADQARELNFTSYTMSSARKHYANFYYLELLKDKYGIDFIGRIWKEADYANKHEHPFQTIQRLLGLDQPGINSFFMEHAMRNVKWDYSSHAAIQTAMDALGPMLNWRPTNILDSLGKDHYAVPDRLAPQQYGYNIVQLYVKDSGCTAPFIHLKFKGHEDANASSGWLYGFVSVGQDNNITYSQQFSDSEVTYKFPADTKEYYLVVMGAPTTFHLHDGMFEIGFPKEFRYAWEVRMQGMVPQGYQNDYHGISAIAGAIHANGGGFVATTAHVDGTAYVGPNAAVLDNAQVTGNARIDGKAVIHENATVSGNAVVSDFADVFGNSMVNDNAHITGQAKVLYSTIADSSVVNGNAVLVYANVSGGSAATGDLFSWGGTISNKAIFGGDAEIFSACANGGKYLQVGGLQAVPNGPGRDFCDGSYTNSLDVDTNAVYNYYGEAGMAFGKIVQCGNVTGEAGAPPIVYAGADQHIVSSQGQVTLTGTASSPAGSITGVQWVKLGGPDGYTAADSFNLTTIIGNITTGVYYFKLIATDNFGNQGSDTVTITVIKANEPPVAVVSADVTITLPANDATVYATASDADGAVTGVSWTQVSGPSNAYIISPGSLGCTMDRLVEGVYLFSFSATDNNGATASDTVKVTVNKALAGNGSGRITTPAIFPVPASGMVTVNYPPTIGGVLSVFDDKGAKVLAKQVLPDTSSISFSVKNLANGVYFIRIDTYSKDKHILKLIVAH